MLVLKINLLWLAKKMIVSDTYWKPLFYLIDDQILKGKCEELLLYDSGVLAVSESCLLCFYFF